MLVLGIESSCDETAAAVVREGRQMLSSVIHSQIALHSEYGGVVPELASREHLTRIEQIVEEALIKADVSLRQIDAIAVTQGPGLVGSLLVGVCYAKALAFGLGIPVIGVNHIEGHVYSVSSKILSKFPAMALIVSGGHTNLFYIPEEGKYKVISRTRDDAAGEAFDKVAKMMGLGYPGGPAIEKLALAGDEHKIRFARAKISDGRPDFSFSGLKTAVSRHLADHPLTDEQSKADLAASFQYSVISSLVRTMEEQATALKPKTLIVAGGVACNAALRKAAEDAADRWVCRYIFRRHLSTDNAAMIAAAGYYHLAQGELSDIKMTADVTLRLQNIDVEKPLTGKKKRYRT